MAKMARSVDCQGDQGTPGKGAGMAIKKHSHAVSVTFCGGLREDESAGEFPPITHMNLIEFSEFSLIPHAQLFKAPLCSGELHQLGAQRAYKRQGDRGRLG